MFIQSSEINIVLENVQCMLTCNLFSAFILYSDCEVIFWKYFSDILINNDSDFFSNAIFINMQFLQCMHFILCLCIIGEAIFLIYYSDVLINNALVIRREILLKHYFYQRM